MKKSFISILILLSFFAFTGSAFAGTTGINLTVCESGCDYSSLSDVYSYIMSQEVSPSITITIKDNRTYDINGDIYLVSENDHRDTFCKENVYYKECISSNRNISLEFAEKYKNKIVWSVFSAYHDMTPRFVERMKSYISWDAICTNKNPGVKAMMADENFLIKYADRIDWEWFNFKTEKYSMNLYSVVEQIIGLDNLWRVIANGAIFDEKVVNRYKKDVDWDKIFRLMPNITRNDMFTLYKNDDKYEKCIDGITEYFDSKTWRKLSSVFATLPDKFIDKYVDEFIKDANIIEPSERQLAKYSWLVAKPKQRIEKPDMETGHHLVYTSGRQIIDIMEGKEI